MPRSMASQKTAFLRVSTAPSSRAMAVSALCARSPRCIASAASTSSPIIDACPNRTPASMSSISQRALSSAATLPSIANRRRGFHRARCRQARAGARPCRRPRAHTLARRRWSLIVATAELPAAVIESAGRPRWRRDRPSCSSNTSPARLRRRSTCQLAQPSRGSVSSAECACDAARTCQRTARRCEWSGRSSLLLQCGVDGLQRGITIHHRERAQQRPLSSLVFAARYSASTPCSSPAISMPCSAASLISASVLRE